MLSAIDTMGGSSDVAVNELQVTPLLYHLSDVFFAAVTTTTEVDNPWYNHILYWDNSSRVLLKPKANTSKLTWLRNFAHDSLQSIQLLQLTFGTRWVGHPGRQANTTSDETAAGAQRLHAVPESPTQLKSRAKYIWHVTLVVNLSFSEIRPNLTV
jgi:hypothetical protein